MYVPAEDVYLPYGCTELSSSPRITQMMRKSENELNKLMQAGFYVEQELHKSTLQNNDIEKKKQKWQNDEQIHPFRHHQWLQ
jgi:hypothetical protein